MRVFQRLILYVFPLYLTAMEQIMRTIFGSEALSLSTVASSISVGGLALLLPYLIPMPFEQGLSRQVIDAMRRSHISAYRSRDQKLAASAWFFLISLTFVWIFSISKRAEAMHSDVLGFEVTLPEVIALSIYVVGIVHTEIKEMD